MRLIGHWEFDNRVFRDVSRHSKQGVLYSKFIGVEGGGGRYVPECFLGTNQSLSKKDLSI